MGQYNTYNGTLTVQFDSSVLLVLYYLYCTTVKFDSSVVLVLHYLYCSTCTVVLVL